MSHKPTPAKTARGFGAVYKGERGQTIIIIAFAALALFAMVGLAIDAGRLYITKAELSRSVDSAALSGILEFNGQQSGLDAGEDKAEQYFYKNEGAEQTTLDIQAYGDKNEMTVDATKTVNLLFMRVLGIKTATVSAHARAGFGTQYLDVVMVLDSTPSMAGTPIENAKQAAINFKNILLGNAPEGNVLVGVTPFRGCMNPPRTQSDCVTTSQISGLSYDNTALNTKINAITASNGGSTSATNVCTGLAKGWEIMAGTVAGQPNHNDDVLYPDNRQFMILLSDGDNAYWGNISYQNNGTSTWVGTNSPYSPTGVTISSTDYPCMPYQTCNSPWGGETQTADYPCEDDTIGTSARGELDDSDGSSPQTCVDVATPRERQMDARTMHLAQAIKAQGVEIFVVAFAGGVAGCDLGDTKVYDDGTPTDCNTVVQSPAGPIGNTDNDNDNSNPANARLLKCIASSSYGTNDHYFFAEDDDDLNGIFTQIANQIAHRLIE